MSRVPLPEPLRPLRFRFALVAILLVAALLRWRGLAAMDGMLTYDEAYNGWDALQSIETGRLTPFLPDNNGRESGWTYWIMPFLLTLGARPFTLHFAAAVTGLLTAAAVAGLGREMFDRRVGLWAALALSLLYWHVHMSHLGLRGILQPLFAALGFTLLLRARRSKRLRLWMLAGLMIGLLVYTYFAARLWILLALLFLVHWLLYERQDRRGVLSALLVLTLFALPQLLFAVRFPDQSGSRIGDVAVLSAVDIWQNTIRWVNAFFGQGDPNYVMNLANRPVLDWALAPPFLLGMLALVAVKKWRRSFALLLGMGAASLSASLFSDNAPHFLRAIGLVLPVALILGLGAETLVSLLRRRFGIAAWLLPLALMGISSYFSYLDFGRWLQLDLNLTSMETYVNVPAAWIRQNVPAASDISIYFSPLSTFHPNIAFQKYGLAPRHVAGQDTHRCLVLTQQRAFYVTVPSFEPEFERLFERWAAPALRVEAARELYGVPLYRIYEAAPAATFADLSPEPDAPQFANSVRIRHSALPQSAAAGETLTFFLAFQAQAPTEAVASAFVHLHGDPRPYQGGQLWAQDDSWLCEAYPSTIWQPQELIIQQFSLALPPEMPYGRYEIAVGMHEAPVGPRLPLTAPTTNPDNYYVIHSLTITE